jgi:hypothetical protein
LLSVAGICSAIASMSIADIPLCFHCSCKLYGTVNSWQSFFSEARSFL